jgi:hypothetical protein
MAILLPASKGQQRSHEVWCVFPLYGSGWLLVDDDPVAWLPWRWLIACILQPCQPTTDWVCSLWVSASGRRFREQVP